MQAIVAEEPDYYWATQQLSDWLVAAKRFEEAVPLEHQLVRLASESELSHGYVAHALIQMERWDEAIPSLERAFQIEPGYLFAGFRLVERYTATNKFDDATRILTILKKSSPVPGTFLRDMQLQGEMRQTDAMCEAARSLAAHSDTSDETFESAASDFHDFGGTTTQWTQIMEQAVVNGPNSSNELAGAWVAAQFRSISPLKISQKIPSLPVSDEMRANLWDRELTLIVNESSCALLEIVIKRNHEFFHKDPWLWNKVVWCYISYETWQESVFWAYDWDTREDVRPFTYNNLALAVEQLEGLLPKAEKMRLKAVESEEVSPIACVCLAFLEAQRGSAEAVAGYRGRYDESELKPFYQFVHHLTSMRLEPKAETLTQALAAFPEYAKEPALRHYYAAVHTQLKSKLPPAEFKSLPWAAVNPLTRFVSYLKTYKKKIWSVVFSCHIIYLFIKYFLW